MYDYTTTYYLDATTWQWCHVTPHMDTTTHPTLHDYDMAATLSHHHLCTSS